VCGAFCHWTAQVDLLGEREWPRRCVQVRNRLTHVAGQEEDVAFLGRGSRDHSRGHGHRHEHDRGSPHRCLGSWNRHHLAVLFEIISNGRDFFFFFCLQLSARTVSWAARKRERDKGGVVQP
jgi:hypothetical protein